MIKDNNHLYEKIELLEEWFEQLNHFMIVKEDKDTKLSNHNKMSLWWSYRPWPWPWEDK